MFGINQQTKQQIKAEIIKELRDDAVFREAMAILLKPELEKLGMQR